MSQEETLQLELSPRATAHEQRHAQAYLPLCVDVSAARTLVVGGGAVAERKALMLLERGAHVRVVAPRVTERLASLAHAGQIEWIERAFEDDDAAGTLLVFAATENAYVNERIEAAARTAGALVNRVDITNPQVSVPATLTRGDLQISVSTTGCSPSLARNLRDELAQHFDDTWGGYVSLLGNLRALVEQRHDDPALRRRLLEAASCADNRTRMMELAQRMAPVEDALAELEQVTIDAAENGGV